MLINVYIIMNLNLIFTIKQIAVEVIMDDLRRDLMDDEDRDTNIEIQLTKVLNSKK